MHDNRRDIRNTYSNRKDTIGLPGSRQRISPTAKSSCPNLRNDSDGPTRECAAKPDDCLRGTGGSYRVVTSLQSLNSEFQGSHKAGVSLKDPHPKLRKLLRYKLRRYQGCARGLASREAAGKKDV